MKWVRQTLDRLLMPVVLCTGVCSALWCIIGRFDLPVQKEWYVLILLAVTFIFYIINTKFTGKWRYCLPGVIVLVAFIGRAAFVRGFQISITKFFGADIQMAGTVLFPEVVACTTFFIVAIGSFLLSVISLSFYKNRHIWLYLFCTLPFVLLPAAEKKVGGYDSLLVYGMSFAIIMAVHFGRDRISDRAKRQVIFVLSGLLIGIAGLSFLICGVQRYDRIAPRIQEVKELVGYLIHWDMSDIMIWSEHYFGGDKAEHGKVGNVDSISQTGEEVLELRTGLPVMSDLYVKEFVGDQFQDNQWEMSNKFSGENNKNWYNLENSFYLMTDTVLYNNGYNSDASQMEYEPVKIIDNLHIKNIGLGRGNSLTTYYPESGFHYKPDGRMKPNQNVEYDIPYYWGLVTRAEALTSIEGGEGQYENAISREEFPEELSSGDYVGNLPVVTSDTDYENAKKGYLTLSCSDYTLSEFSLWMWDTLQRNKQKDFISYKSLISCVKTNLEREFTYTKSPGKTPEGENAIDYFVQKNRKGYCSHFASTAVMFFRYMGVPARYVEGYHVEDYRMSAVPSGDGKYEYAARVTDKDAHAWVEIYIKTIGWMPVDVTPAQDNAPAAVSAQYNHLPGGNGQSSSTRRNSEYFKKKQEQKKETTETSKKKQEKTPVPTASARPVENSVTVSQKADDREEHMIWQKLLTVLFILIAVVLFAAFIYPKWYQYRLRKMTPAKRTLSRYYHMGFFLLCHHGLYRGETLAGYGEKLQKAFGCKKELADKLADYFLRAAFGKQVYFDEDDREFERLLKEAKEYSRHRRREH